MTAFGLFEFLLVPFGLSCCAKLPAFPFQRNFIWPWFWLCLIRLYIGRNPFRARTYRPVKQGMQMPSSLRDLMTVLKISCVVRGFLSSSSKIKLLHNKRKGNWILPRVGGDNSKLKCPSTVQSLRLYLNLLNYYHLNISRASHTQTIHWRYLKGSRVSENVKIQWTEEPIKAFEISND